MGKLVKINNQQQTTGEIKAYFQEGFTIPPMGTIGLINMSCEMEDKNILISNDNNTFQRRVALVLGFDNVVMRNGLYDIKTFVRELNRALNASLRNNDDTEQGFQFKPSITTRNFCKISFNRVSIGPASYYLRNQRLAWRDGTTEHGNGYIKNKAGDAWDAALCTNKFFTGGAGAFTCILVNVNPIIIGLVTSNAKLNYEGIYDIEAYDFCMYIAPRSGAGAVQNVYWCRYIDGEGVIVDFETNVQPAVNHTIGLMLSGGKLIYGYGLLGLPQPPPDPYKPTADNANFNILLELDWEYDKSYFGMLSIYNNNTVVNYINFWQDPYHQITKTFSHYHEEAPEYNMRLEDIDELDIDDPDVGGALVSRVTLQMPQSVLLLLGFQANPPQSANVKSGSFTGTRPYTNIILPHNMKIILDNLDIESYDNVLKQKESILMTIPSLTADDGKFVYDAQFPLQIELKNKFPINISELRLRLVDFQRNLIRIKPDVTDITLFIS